MCRSVFKEWTVDDLRSLINNEDFRENQFIDYKRTFDFLEAVDKLQKVKGKNEFRNDVCSFANADGGNLIFGISEKNGIAYDGADGGLIFSRLPTTNNLQIVQCTNLTALWLNGKMDP